MFASPNPDKYARIERERRFLLARDPADLLRDVAAHPIVDRYIHHTRFRLRRIDRGDGAAIYKLTQKYVRDGDDLARVTITNTYLTEREYRVFAALPADELRKDRSALHVDGQHFAIDVFGGSLAGLVLAEIEFDSDEALAAFVPPPFLGDEVTADARFTGGQLCRPGATFAR